MRRQSRLRPRFAVCIKNKGYEAALERGKVYRMIPDSEAAKHGYVWIVDESGEDYGYSAERFIAVHLPKPLEKALLEASPLLHSLPNTLIAQLSRITRWP